MNMPYHSRRRWPWSLAAFLLFGGVVAWAAASPEPPRDEALWDSCDSLDAMAPIFWQKAWDPNAFQNQRAGTLAVCTEEKIEGKASLRWTVAPEDFENLKARAPDESYVMINRLYGQAWSNVREVRFHLRCRSPKRPPVRIHLVGHETAFEQTVLERGESTDGWKEIRLDVSELDLGTHPEYGQRLWFFRLFALREEFEPDDRIDLHLDNIRWVVPAAEAVIPVLDPPAAAATPATAVASPDAALAGQRFRVWPYHYARLGHPQILPEPPRRTTTDTSEVGSVRLFASPGETVPASLYVRPVGDQPLESVRLRLEAPLRAAGDRTIPENAVGFHAVRVMKRWLDSTRYVPTETYLVPAEPEDLAPHASHRFWMLVAVPEDAAPGVYRSRIAVSPRNADPVFLDFELEVLPIVLAAPENMAYFLYYSPYLLPEPFRNSDFQRRVFTDMAERGMTTVTGYFHPRGDLLEGTLEGYLPVRETLEALKETDLVTSGTPLLWIGADTLGDYAWKTLLDAAAERDWPEWVFYMIDEPSPARYPTVEAVMARLAAFREQHPDRPVRTATALGPGAIRDIGHHYDIWICGAGAVNETIARMARDANKELWAYECHFAPTHPELSRYYFGFWAWKAGVRGVAYWAYYDGAFYNRFGNIGAYENVRADWLDWTNQFNFAFPTEKGIVPTLGWEAARQGVNDFRYIRTLEIAVERAEAILAAEGNAKTTAKPRTDAGTVAGTVAGTDTGMDAKTDAGTVSGTVAGTDAGTVAGTDAKTVAGTVAGTDTGTDTGMDAKTDAGTDVGTVAGTVAGTDADAGSRDALATAIARARETLDEIRRAIHVENLRQTPAPERADWPDAAIFDRPSPEAALAPEDYDRLRRRLAEAIVRLR